MNRSRSALPLLASLMVLGACGVTPLPPTMKAAATAADFALPDQNGQTVKLADLTADSGHAVLVFLRGHW